MVFHSDDFCLYLPLEIYEIQGNKQKSANNVEKNLLNWYVQTQIIEKHKEKLVKLV